MRMISCRYEKDYSKKWKNRSCTESVIVTFADEKKKTVTIDIMGLIRNVIPSDKHLVSSVVESFIEELSIVDDITDLGEELARISAVIYGLEVKKITFTGDYRYTKELFFQKYRRDTFRQVKVPPVCEASYLNNDGSTEVIDLYYMMREAEPNLVVTEEVLKNVTKKLAKKGPIPVSRMTSEIKKIIKKGA